MQKLTEKLLREVIKSDIKHYKNFEDWLKKNKHNATIAKYHYPELINF